MLRTLLQEIKKNQQSYQSRLKQKCDCKLQKLKCKVFKNSVKKNLLEIRDMHFAIEHILKRADSYKNSLIIDIAKSLIDVEVKNNTINIVNIVQNLLNNISENVDVEITAHEKDVLTLENYQEELNQSFSCIRKIYFKRDNNIALGGLIIKANKNIIDAQILTQINQGLAILQEQER